MTQASPLVGVWRIVSFQVEIEGAKESQEFTTNNPPAFSSSQRRGA